MIVLDTHAWWWTISEPDFVSEKAAELIKSTSPEQLAVASISLWEFAMMVDKGRIDLKIDPDEWFQYSINKVGIKILPLTPTIALDSCNLPGKFHKDPADRIILSTSRTHQAKLITKDRKIREYSHVQSVW